MDATNLVKYNHHVWRRFADYYVDECTWDELSENHETSHNTIANVTMHAVNMEDWWLHYVIPAKPWDGPAWDGFTSATQMRERIHDVEKRTEALLANLTREDLTRPRTIEAYGEKQTVTLEDILVEIVNEATHHRGEVLAMLWRNDKEAPYENYLDWRASQATTKTP